MLKPNKNKNGNGSYAFTQSNYNAGLCGSGHTLTGSIPQGNSTYDAARANMREPWMMFTKKQGQELIDNTIYEWTSINEVNGYKLTSKINQSNHIFLPAAGECRDIPFTSSSTRGNYWSTTWNSSSYAWYLDFGSSILLISGAYYHRYGLSIRAVRSLEW